ncbi:MAG: aminotransferase class I/II-fold pyridoxal phosphate-dependent enzyme [Verrucomicrobiota bacterium]
MKWESYLNEQLDTDRRQHLGRTCTTLPDGMLSFGSNDYMGFSRHPQVIEAAASSLDAIGLGPRSARLLAGHTRVHQELENQLAELKLAEAALTFPNGYTTAIGVIPTLVRSSATVILDEKCHACLWDGARLSGAKVRMMRHNDLEHLQEILELERQRDADSVILLIVESLYSMDGDRAPLDEIVKLKEQWNAWLLVDEAHALGVFGAGGQGCIETQALADQIEVQLGTLGKSVGSLGGFAAGSEQFIRLLRQRARSFIFTTATPPAIAAAALAGVKLISSTEGADRRKKLARLVGHAANQSNHPLEVHSQIIPIPIGQEEKAMQLAGDLWSKKIYLPAIRYPTVPRGEARLRLSLNATHTTTDLDNMLKLLKELTPAT